MQTVKRASLTKLAKLGKVYILIAILSGCAATDSAPSAAKRAALPDANYPGQSRHSAEEVQLGKLLFFDTRLSVDKSMSCASCHKPELGFTDGLTLARGLNNKTLKRHTPHLYNLAWNRTFFWDGRVTSLEAQAVEVMHSADEFNISPDELRQRLSAVDFYRRQFAKLYPDGISMGNAAKAIAAFERTLVSHNSQFDRYIGGESTLLDPSARLGMQVFFSKGKCSRCHAGPNFTDDKFHNTGVAGEDPGRSQLDRTGEFQTTPYPFFHTQKAFKTPSLRNVALTPPYMHNGSETTLEDVVDFYNNGGRDHKSYGLSLDVRPLNLSAEEKQGLLAFLHTLTSPVTLTPPTLPE